MIETVINNVKTDKNDVTNKYRKDGPYSGNQKYKICYFVLLIFLYSLGHDLFGAVQKPVETQCYIWFYRNDSILSLCSICKQTL